MSRFESEVDRVQAWESDDFRRERFLLRRSDLRLSTLVGCRVCAGCIFAPRADESSQLNGGSYESTYCDGITCTRAWALRKCRQWSDRNGLGIWIRNGERKLGMQHDSVGHSGSIPDGHDRHPVPGCRSGPIGSHTDLSCCRWFGFDRGRNSRHRSWWRSKRHSPQQLWMRPCASSHKPDLQWTVVRCWPWNRTRHQTVLRGWHRQDLSLLEQQQW